MKYCSKCGTAIDDSAAFCAHCGSRVGAPSQRVDISGQYNQIQRPVSRANSWMGIVSFIISFFVITSPIAIVLGILDLCIMKGPRHHGLAIWGIVIGTIFTVIAGIGLFVGYTTEIFF